MDTARTASNFGLKDEIKAYWSQRAESFDSQAGHEIFSESERAAWHRLIIKHLGPGDRRRALDLASGTGVVSHLLDDLDFDVTGMDWAEPMLELARSKTRLRDRNVCFMIGDAESTMEPDNYYEVITNRHLVWTLVDPEAAFQEWFRVLKPGGKLLLIDGDFVNPGRVARIAAALARALALLRLPTGSNEQEIAITETHRNILSRAYFSNGARADKVAALLARAGFEDIIIDTDLRAIHNAQKANFPWLKRIERATQHRFSICAIKPTAMRTAM